MKGKKTFFTLVLALVLAIAVFTGLAYAAEDDTTSISAYPITFFDLTLPKGGVTVTGLLREKVSPDGYAYFDLDTVENNSGLMCYINVREKLDDDDSLHIAGKADRVSGTGEYYVTYLSGRGTVGHEYAPSAQTDSDSTSGATVGGFWRP